MFRFIKKIYNLYMIGHDENNYPISKYGFLGNKCKEPLPPSPRRIEENSIEDVLKTWDEATPQARKNLIDFMFKD